VREQRKRRIPKQVRWTVSVFLVALVVEYLVVPTLAGARKSLHLLGRVNVALLILGVALEFASLLAYAELTHTVLPGKVPSRWRLLRINTSSLALSHVVPGGTAPATGLTYRLLGDEGVHGADAAFALAMQGVGSAVVLNLMLWVVLIVSIFLHGYNWLYGAAAGVGVLLMAAFAGVVILLLRGHQRGAEIVRRLGNHIPFVSGDALAHAVERIAERLRSFLDDRTLMRRAVLWAAANWLLDAASLWVFVFAFHKVVGPDELLVAYCLANVLAVIPVTPGGLGIVEAVEISTLVGFGMKDSVATLAVVSYRLVNFWLPIPAGFGTYLSLRFSREHGWRHRIQAGRAEAGQAAKSDGATAKAEFSAEARKDSKAGTSGPTLGSGADTI
jgi:uncharacterized protein (TIRG00374 family)